MPVVECDRSISYGELCTMHMLEVARANGGNQQLRLVKHADMC